mmetsp:Transcript_5195/g.13004  ORF Transcript_5195/g.13004 Transcript_5195/m.13004 type:complete len:204 (-) Transcript_5195:635-1246(-)
MPPVNVSIAPTPKHVLPVRTETDRPRAAIHLQISHPPPRLPIHQYHVSVVSHECNIPAIRARNELLEGAFLPPKMGRGGLAHGAGDGVVREEEGPAAGQDDGAGVSEEGGLGYGHLGKVYAVHLRVILPPAHFLHRSSSSRPVGIGIAVDAKEAEHLVHPRRHEQRRLLVAPGMELTRRDHAVVGIDEVGIPGAHHVQQCRGD